MACVTIGIGRSMGVIFVTGVSNRDSAVMTRITLGIRRRMSIFSCIGSILN